MDRARETELFTGLMRNRPFREWLDGAMAEQVKVLMVNQDGHQLARAQGAAGLIRLMQDKISAAETAAKR